MFKFFLLLVCISLISAVPVHDVHDEHEHEHEHEHEMKEIVTILKSEINKHDDGSYNVEYANSDGSSRQEQATIVDAGTDEQALEIKGSYKYINDEGAEVEVFYTAGKNGFVPYGSSINPEITAVAEAAKDLPKVEDLLAQREKAQHQRQQEYQL